MAVPISRASIPKMLWEGVRRFYDYSWKQHPAQFIQIFDRVPSDKMYEEDVSQSDFGLIPEKTEGEAVTFDTITQGYVTRTTNVTYALGFIITLEMLEDDLYAKAGMKDARALAKSDRHTKETISSNIFNRAFDSDYTGTGGKEMCSLTHPLPGSAGYTFQNKLTTAADISELALEQAYVDIEKWTDSRSKKINATPQGVIIPPDLQFEATRILKSTLQSGTANNDINAIRSMGKFPQGAMTWNWLTDTDAWFIKTDVEPGLIYQDRKKSTFKAYHDNDTTNAKFMTRSRYAFNWINPMVVFASEGA